MAQKQWASTRLEEPLPRHNFSSVLALGCENLWFMAFCWFCQITCVVVVVAAAFLSISLACFLVVVLTVVVVVLEGANLLCLRVYSSV